MQRRNLSPPSDVPVGIYTLGFRCLPCLKIKMDYTCCGSYSGSCEATHPGNRTEGKPAAPSNPTQGFPVFQPLAFHCSTPSSHFNSAALRSFNSIALLAHLVCEPMVPCPHCWDPPEASYKAGMLLLLPSTFPSQAILRCVFISPLLLSKQPWNCWCFF